MPDDELEEYEPILSLMEGMSDFDMKTLYEFSGSLDEGEDWRDKPFPLEPRG
jgi:hypothetical protein